MRASVAERRDTRSKQAPECRVEGGRPEHGWLLHLEGHVDDLIAETDDARLFERAAHAMRLIEGALLKARAIHDNAANFAASCEANRIFDRIAVTSHRLSDELRRRAVRLVKVVVPEIRRCYDAGEKFFTEVVKA